MKPRTFTILAVVLGVIAVSLYVASRVLSSRVDDLQSRIGIALESRRSLAEPGESQRAQVTADLAEAKLTLERSRLLRGIGFGGWMLALLAISMRRYLAHRAAESLASQRDGPAADDQPPIATTT